MLYDIISFHNTPSKVASNMNHAYNMFYRTISLSTLRASIQYLEYLPSNNGTIYYEKTNIIYKSTINYAAKGPGYWATKYSINVVRSCR